MYPNDPLLTGVDPLNFRVLSSPRVDLPQDGTTILTLGDEPFLYRLEEEERDVLLIAPDLMETNLPLTIDFPLLVRNILTSYTTLASPITHAWSIVGEPVDIDAYGTLLVLEDPNHQEIPLAAEARSFIPQAPGIYTLRTTKGVYPLAVNVDPAESAPPGLVLHDTPAEPIRKQAQALFPLWPYIAGLAFLFLLLEGAIYHGWSLRRRRQ